MKSRDYHSSVALLSGSLLASGLYLASFHLVPPASWIFFSLVVLLGLLGIVKFLNYFASSLSSPLNRTICWLHSISFEIFAIAASFLWKFLGWSDKKSGPKSGRPILLIHGYLQNASNWVLLKRRLRQRGFGSLYTMNLVPPFRSIRDYAEQVALKAEAIAEETKRNDLTLIGHSMGGLVSAWYAAKVAEPGKVGNVITIGSPMGGTRLATIAIGPNGREMECGSDFVGQLQKELRQNDQVQFYHIASKADQIVLPFSSALTGLHPEREFLVDDLGHMSLLYSLRVADKIEEWIRDCQIIK